jgi:hypothetical protein
MAQQVSAYLGINSDDLENASVLDTVIGVDTRLYVDPLLLNVAKTPEFKNSRQKIEKHYRRKNSTPLPLPVRVRESPLPSRARSLALLGRGL